MGMYFREIWAKEIFCKKKNRIFSKPKMPFFFGNGKIWEAVHFKFLQLRKFLFDFSVHALEISGILWSFEIWKKNLI